KAEAASSSPASPSWRRVVGGGCMGPHYIWFYLREKGKKLLLIRHPLLHPPEGAAVQVAGAPAAQGLQVFGGGVALVPGKIVLGIAPVQLLHEPVPVHLGQDGGRGDRRAKDIPL